VCVQESLEDDDDRISSPCMCCVCVCVCVQESLEDVDRISSLLGESVSNEVIDEVSIEGGNREQGTEREGTFDNRYPRPQHTQHARARARASKPTHKRVDTHARTHVSGRRSRYAHARRTRTLHARTTQPPRPRPSTPRRTTCSASWMSWSRPRSTPRHIYYIVMIYHYMIYFFEYLDELEQAEIETQAFIFHLEFFLITILYLFITYCAQARHYYLRLFLAASD
jgi:hypothetical protein